ncbi:MAG: ATP-binding protein [Pikeienuella sp.]|uniref:hybrid sensor histidine kinase/response regulator n=1 Tax=Pikeienuella sp. TaxID=2831957 RepID=UPI00391CE254
MSDPLRQPRRVAVRALIGSLAGLALLAAGFTGLRLWEELAQLRASPSDNVQWTFAQVEVDLLQFRRAAAEVAAGEATPAEMRRAFDLFYSRIRTLERGAVFEALRAEPEVGQSLGRIQAFLAGAIPLVDGPDDALVAASPGFAEEAAALQQVARAMSLTGVRIFARMSDERRAGFRSTLAAAAALAAGLIAALIVSLYVINRQRAVSLRRAAAAERIGRRLAATVEASLDAVIVADARGVVTDWNRAAERIFGHSPEAALGRDMQTLIVPHRHRAAHSAGMKRFLTTGERRVIGAGRIEMTALRAGGEEFPVELAVAVSEDHKGPIFVSYLRDISDRLAAERDLRGALEAATSAHRAKSEFIAVMSHEMRTPLNGVIGLVDLLLRSGLDERQRRFAESAAASGEILLRHVNDVLDIVRADAGRLTLSDEPIDIAAVVREAIEIVRPLAEEQGDSIDFDPGEGLGALRGDARRVRQIALNLLGNAVKFTESGSIRVSLALLRQDEAGAEVELVVEDTGCGVPEAEKERIFEDFVMLDPSYERKASGSGLGLAIVRRMAQAMGGSAHVEPVESGGSRFRVVMRLARGEASEPAAEEPAPPPSPSAAPTASLRVLLVEDNGVNRMVFGEILRAAGHEIVEAADGRAGVAAAERERFDAVLMDISMPVMNGVEAARAIRGGDGPNRLTPIVGLTAHALPEELARFAEVGIRPCLTKPLRSRDLERALAALPTDGEGAATGDAENEEEQDPLFDDESIAELALSLDEARLKRTLLAVAAELEAGPADLASGAWPERRALAHRLAGSAALVGASRARSALIALETACAHKNPPAWETAEIEFEAVLPDTLSALREYADSIGG